MQIFISYAHTDADGPLALGIAARLRAVGLDVWMDKSSLSPADRTREAIERGAADSDHAVFLVSRSWLARDWTEWELGLFKQRDPAVVRRVPILRRPRRELQLPPALYKFTGFEWLEDDADEDARFWELHCALSGIPPGPPDGWTERGRGLGPGTARIGKTRRRRQDGPVRRSLKCDRALQWKTVDDLATSGGNELLLVPGAAGQDHEHFSQRIQWYLRPSPERSIERIEWSEGRPKSAGEFREAIATKLDVSSEDLEIALSERLAHKNLVLLHPCVRARFMDSLLVQYYAVWLPEWLAASHARMNLKCVQPVEWPPETLGSKLLRLVPGRAPGDHDGRSEANELIRQLLSSSAPLLRALPLTELHDISDEELHEFCQVIGLSDAQRVWLLGKIKSRHPRAPKDVFQAIDDYFPELPDARSTA